ncbi:uncharacterized protein LOC101856629 [Aplysia californica]|uniref:Uncharacterized protein LOC101856629 n=1 Tax=Aplysia californica TaxID=6500 RepID=A0ABM0KAH8_APLCA|nr:uncharacterized protein LOC101856629 [Aplysia californica]
MMMMMMMIDNILGSAPVDKETVKTLNALSSELHCKHLKKLHNLRIQSPSTDQRRPVHSNSSRDLHPHFSQNRQFRNPESLSTDHRLSSDRCDLPLPASRDAPLPHADPQVPTLPAPSCQPTLQTSPVTQALTKDSDSRSSLQALDRLTPPEAAPMVYSTPDNDNVHVLYLPVQAWKTAYV